MLRVNQKTDGQCPICKLPVSRRSVRPSPVLQSAASAFELLAEAYRQTTGLSWEDGDPDPASDKENLPKSNCGPGADIFVTAVMTPKKWNFNGDNQPSSISSTKRKHLLDCPFSDPNSPSRPKKSIMSSGLEELRKSKGQDLGIFPSNNCDDTSEPVSVNTVESTQQILNADFYSYDDHELASPVTGKCPQSGRKGGNGKSIVICTSRCSINVPSVISGIKHTKGIRQCSNFDPKKVTHLVIGVIPPASMSECGESTSSRIAASRTMKYLQAILAGCWIVSEAWLYDSFRAGYPLPEINYEVQGDEEYPNESAPMRARLSREGFGAGLFSGISFVLVGNFKSPTREQLCSLIEAGAGRVVCEARWPRRLSSHNFKTYYVSENPDGIGFPKDDGRNDVIISTSWLLACVSSLQILNDALK